MNRSRRAPAALDGSADNSTGNDSADDNTGTDTGDGTGDDGLAAALSRAFRLAVLLRALCIVAVLPMELTLGGVGHGPAGALLAGAVTSLVQIRVVLARGRRVSLGLPVALVDLAGAVVVYQFDGAGFPLALFLLGSCGLAAVAFGPRGLVPAGLLAAGAATAVAGTAPAPAVRAIAAGLPSLFVVVGAAGVAVRFAIDREHLLGRRLQAAAGRAAAVEERVRLAREMHDCVVNALHGIALTAQALAAALGRGADGRQLARDLAEAAENAGAQARSLLRALRDDDLRDDLRDVVRRDVEEWQQHTGTVVRLSIEGDPELAAEPRYQLLRVLQESLHNVDKHAAAQRVHVRLGLEAGRVLLSVTDDGRGFSPPGSLEDLSARGHYGLIGMLERARSVGATVTVAGRPGRGTTVTFRSGTPAAAAPDQVVPPSPQAPGRRWPAPVVS